MAAFGSWPSIRKHGLLSTRALTDLFEVPPREKSQLLSMHRPNSVQLRHPIHGGAEIRDQKPMSDLGLQRALKDGLTPKDWYEMLNSMVFFWVSKKRLLTLVNARAYRELPHTILEVDTAKVLAEHEKDVVLSPINSGATKPFPWPRGRDTFKSIPEYPFEKWTQKRGSAAAVVELAVRKGIPGIGKAVIHVEHRYPDGKTEILI
jgi:hypothetical protein